jgi:signal transduction histidine kinase
VRWLRAVLVAVTLAALCGAAWVAGVGVVRKADRPSVDEHRAEMAAQARLAAVIVGRWMTDSRAQLNSARAGLQPWSASSSQLAAAGATLNAHSGGNLDGGLVIVNRESFVVAASTNLAGAVGLRRPSTAVEAAFNGQDATGDVAVERLTKKVVVPVTTPLTGPGGGITAVLVGFTELSTTPEVPTGALAAAVAAAQDAVGHPVEVATQGGTIVSPIPPSTSRVIRYVDDSLRPAIAAAGNGSGVVTFKGEGKADTIAAYAKLADFWTVVLPRPAAGLAVTGDRATSSAAGVLAVVLAAAFVLLVAVLAELQRRTAHVEESKKAFLAIAGHELRTPLTVMKGYTDLLVERWDDVADDMRQNVVETVSYQVRNLEHLVERLLLGAQLEAGVSPSTVKESVELGPLLEAAAQHHRAIAPTHSFVVDVEDGLTARGDATALNHVVTNLVENAVKYSPDGGTVTMRAAASDRGRVQLIVDDEGIGLPGNLDLIFEKFVQREAVDRRVHDEGGVGLGLYIVRTLVEQMGGTVRAQRRSPKGASFVVTLQRAV